MFCSFSCMCLNVFYWLSTSVAIVCIRDTTLIYFVLFFGTRHVRPKGQLTSLVRASSVTRPHRDLFTYIPFSRHTQTHIHYTAADTPTNSAQHSHQTQFPPAHFKAHCVLFDRDPIPLGTNMPPLEGGCG